VCYDEKWNEPELKKNRPEHLPVVFKTKAKQKSTIKHFDEMRKSD